MYGLVRTENPKNRNMARNVAKMHDPKGFQRSINISLKLVQVIVNFFYPVGMALTNVKPLPYCTYIYVMNYLAHAYLSFNSPEILVGNLISDFVKGKRKFEYSAGIQNGIALHRQIDRFTDEHEATHEAKKFFKPAYRLYSASFVDVVYDHFLATDGSEFDNQKLLDFTKQVYSQLEPFTPVFPEKFRMMFPFMKSQNWLFNYKFKWGIERSFEGLVRRSTYLTESESAFRIFEENYVQLRQFYHEFFPALKKMAATRFAEISERTT